MTLNYGGIRCDTNNFKLAPKAVAYKGKILGVKITNLPTDTTFGWDMNKKKRTIDLIDVMVKNATDAELVLSKLQALSTTGTSWKMEWDWDGNGTLFKFDGTNAYINVLQVGVCVLEKDNPSSVFIFPKISFQEAEK